MLRQRKPLPPHKITYIYALIDPRTDAIRYIGRTVNMEVRLSGHLSDMWGTPHKRGRLTRKEAWLAELLGSGLDPEIRLLSISTWERSQEDERTLVAHYISGGCDLTNALHPLSLGPHPNPRPRGLRGGACIGWT